MSDSTAPVGEKPVEENDEDAFGSLAMARTAPEPPKTPEPVVTKEEQLKRLVPEQHRESFSHSATWWQNNIEIFRHKVTGRYLYLSKETQEAQVHAYQYTAIGHRFFEIPMEEAIAFATLGEKVGEKKRY
jgi:hypothetical protein